MNLIASDELNPQKTRILPTPALLKPRTTAKLQNLFYSYRSNAVVITASIVALDVNSQAWRPSEDLSTAFHLGGSVAGIGPGCIWVRLWPQCSTALPGPPFCHIFMSLHDGGLRVLVLCWKAQCCFGATTGLSRYVTLSIGCKSHRTH